MGEFTPKVTIELSEYNTLKDTQKWVDGLISKGERSYYVKGGPVNLDPLIGHLGPERVYFFRIDFKDLEIFFKHMCDVEDLRIKEVQE